MADDPEVAVMTPGELIERLAKIEKELDWLLDNITLLGAGIEECRIRDIIHRNMLKKPTLM